MSRIGDCLSVGEVMVDVMADKLDQAHHDLRDWGSDDLKRLRSGAQTLGQLCNAVLTERFVP